MHLLIDSTEFCKDFNLQGPDFRVLLDVVVQTGDSIYVPQVVIDEVCNKYREKLQSSRLKIQSEYEELGRLTLGQVSNSREVTDEEIARVTERHRAALLKRLRDAKATILPYPEIPHEQLVQRALMRKKPFSESGAGYRDALIWEGVKALIPNETAQVVLVTGNTRDFSDGKGHLHADLVDDLIQSQLSSDSVELVPSLHDFVERKIVPTLEKLEEAKLRLAKGQYHGINLSELIADQANDFIRFREVDPTDIGLPAEFENPGMAFLEDVQLTSVDSVRQIPSGELLVEVKISAICDFDFYVYKSDLHVLSDNDMPTIIDSNWTDRHVWASKSKPVDMGLTLTMDVEKQRITSVEVSWIAGQEQ